MPFVLKSSAFAAGASIPTEHTCKGADTSPPLEWSNAPAGTASFALIVDDPDAPDPAAPKMTWVHWVLFNIPAATSSLPVNAAARGLPPGCVVGTNDWKKRAYGGPCPPIGRHRYFFKLYAVDTMLSLSSVATKADVETALLGHILAQATLMGTFRK